MLRFAIAAFLSLISICVQAQAQNRIEFPKTWLNELVDSPSVIQVRFPRGSYTAPPSGIDANFIGNPLKTIVSIDTSGGIITSRDDVLAGCKDPCFVHASAKAITAVGTSYPYMDLSCSWNFGDPSGTETFVRPTDGVTVNANTDQTGCDAAYPYRTGGATYTITLTLKGSNGTCNSTGRCAVTTATVTKNITVTAFSATGGELWYDSNFAGTGLGTFAAPYKLASDFPAGNTLLNSGDNVAVNVKRGSDFTVIQGWEVYPGADRTGIRIRAYGAGADPIIRADASTTRIGLSIGGGNGSPTVNVSDIVVSGLQYINSTYTGGVLSIGNRRNSATPGGNTTNVYLDNVWMENTSYQSGAPNVVGVGGAGGTPLLEEGNKFGCWKCTVKNSTTSNNIAIGKLGSAATWDFFVGGMFEGGGTSTAFDHHYYPDTRENFLAQWTTYGITGNQGLGTVAQAGTVGFTAGTSYTSGSYSAVPLTGGSGTGATANITVSGGGVTVVQIVSNGSNYNVGDTLSASSANIGGTGSGFITTVNNTSGRNFSLNGNWDGTFLNYNDHQTAQYHVINENSFIGTTLQGPSHTIDLGNRTNNQEGATFTGVILSTTLTVSGFSGNALAAGAVGTGSTIINGFAGGTLINGTRLVGSASVSPGLCTPNCTGAGGNGTYSVDTSQVVTSQTMLAADATVWFDNVIISGNFEKGVTQGSMVWGNGRNVTIRDDRVTGGTGEWFRPAINQIPGYTIYQNAVYSIYRNHIYMGASTNSCMICFNVGKTWTTAQYVSYNIFADGRSTPKFEEFIWADFISSAAVWDYNTWSVMGGANTTPWIDTSTAKTFANWQNAGSAPARWGAHDTNLVATVPSGWTNPPTTWAQMP